MLLLNFFALWHLSFTQHLYLSQVFQYLLLTFFSWFFTHFSGHWSVYWEARSLAEVSVKPCLWSAFVLHTTVYCFHYLSIQGPSFLYHGYLDSFSLWHWILSKAFCWKTPIMCFSKAVGGSSSKKWRFLILLQFLLVFML